MPKLELQLPVRHLDFVPPVAYIDLVAERHPHDSASQVVIALGDLPFTVGELIFDLDSEGHVIGVELL